MRFKELSIEDHEFIKKTYNEASTRLEAQEELSEKYDVSKRTVRKWAYNLGLGVMDKNIKHPPKVMIYDIETSRGVAKVWWSGKQFVNGNNFVKYPKIISICWKWLGEDKIFSLKWGKNQDDKKMLAKFLKEYNKADMVIGQNNDRFDNRWVYARAAKHDLDVNTLVRSFDIMKQNKRIFRLPSYSMKFMCKYFDVEQKLEHEGIKMWDMIEDGTPEEKEEYLAKMIEYNEGDIISTEALYRRLSKYYGHKTHFGVLHGEERYTCPRSGTKDVFLYKTSVTPKGTIQRIMKSNYDGSLFSISNRIYMQYLEDKMLQNKLKYE